MDSFIKLSADRKLNAFQQVDAEMGLQAASVEKDFWVCWTLHALFSMPDIGCHLTFKGGTSLSKAWGIIKRFSEDIDLVVDKKILGFDGDASPDKAPSKKQRKVRLEGLMEACRKWVQGTLQPALALHLEAALGKATDWSLKVDPDMEDGQCLLFQYPTVFPPSAAGSVNPVVKIELGARSDDWPHEDKLIQPYVIEHFPALGASNPFPVRVLMAERTFWEKACLLHEETFRPADKPRKPGMARHYYDFWCLLRAGVGERALQQIQLFQRVTEHREFFFRHSWVDYSTHKQGTFRLTPRADQVSNWRADYQAMSGSIFFDETPDFEEILAAVSKFERDFNSTASK